MLLFDPAQFTIKIEVQVYFSYFLNFCNNIWCNTEGTIRQQNEVKLSKSKPFLYVLGLI